MSEESGDDTEQVWEVGVCEAGHPNDWSHYHPTADSEDEAGGKAQKEARSDGYTDPCVYMVEGPFERPVDTGTDQ